MRNSKNIRFSATDAAVAGRAAMPRVKTGAKTRSKKKVSIKKKSKPLSIVGVTLIIVFVLFSIVMVQNLYLMTMDQDVSALQIEYETTKAINDSKEAKIIESCKYDAIVPKAKSYGMTEITQDQKIAMEVEKQDRKIKDFYIDSMIQ